MTGNDTALLAALIVVSYLAGSFPTGLLLGRACGVDVRKEGSGNIGATNLYRTVGRKVGVLTLAGDCLKGLLPVLLVKHGSFPVDYAVWVGFAAFCGHVFSVFLKFKGGKGVATALGVFLGLAPVAVAAAVAVFALFMLVWRYVSLSSIGAAIAMPLATVFLGCSRNMVLVTLLIAAIVIARHHENIRRLVDGTENRFKV